MADKPPPMTASKTPGEIPDSVSVELKKAREGKGLSLSDLHRATGISRTSLHDYEVGRSKPGAREIVKLSKVLEVSPNRLLLGMEDPYIGSDGVMLALIGMARQDPVKAAALSSIFMPLLASTLNKLGNETLTALAVIADETLRARDPESFVGMAKSIAIFKQINMENFSTLSIEERASLVGDMWAVSEKTDM